MGLDRCVFLGIRGEGGKKRQRGGVGWGGGPPGAGGGGGGGLGESTVLHGSLFVNWQKEKEKKDNLIRSTFFLFFLFNF
jgi:hypothetical protein